MKFASRRVVAVLAVGLLVATGCTKSDDDETGSETQSTTVDNAAAVTADLVASGLLWDDGPCDPALPEVPLGTVVPFNAGYVSLEEQALAAQASAVAFNARGGIAGRCINMITCDDGGDPNKGADCARSMIEQNVVAEINDTATTNGTEVLDLFTAAGIPRFDGSPAPESFGSDTTYTLGLGGLGNTAMCVPALVEQGATKLAIIRPDLAGAGVMRDLFGPMATALGAEIVADIPVTVGTSDYSQFVLAAQSAGADGIILATGSDDATQVLRAAQQLSTDLKIALSLGSVTRASVAEFGDFADQLVFNGDIPPATADPTPYPLLTVAASDIAASGKEELQPDELTTSGLKSWVFMFALISILRDAAVTDITAATVTQALQAATDVDMGGLTPPWTPNATSEGLFKRVSDPWYWTASWDGATDNFLVGPDQINAVELLAGNAS